MKIRIRTNARAELIRDNVPPEIADKLVGNVFLTTGQDLFEVPFEWIGIKSTWNIRPELAEIVES